jgi:23S rRNA (adenine2503-C2)-methyltransferase
MNLLGLLPTDLSALLHAAGVPAPEGDARRVLARLISEGRSDVVPRGGLRRVVVDALAAHSWSRPTVVERVPDSDGGLRYVFQADDGALFDVVRIPLHVSGRYSVCLSSQVGCAMQCAFCATGKLGLTRNLSASEIIGAFLAVRDELRAAEPDSRVTGAVFMGQGEPLHNYDAVLQAAHVLRDPCGGRIASEAISISTVGLVPAIRRFALERQPFRLILSLTSADPTVRRRLLPVAGRHDLAELAEALSLVHEAQGDRVTLAWVLLGGVNTDPAEVERIGAAFGHLPLRINLIDVNANPVSPDGEASGETFRRATDEERNTFMDALQVLKSPVVRRYSVGRDQNAACGMLAARTAVEPDTASCS